MMFFSVRCLIMLELASALVANNFQQVARSIANFAFVEH